MIRTIAVPLLAVLLVTAGAVGAVAAPGQGNAPADAGPNDADDADAGDDADDGDADGPPGDAPAGPDADANANASESRGPPVDLPAPVPDHVSAIHDAIREKIDGALSGAELGDVVSDLTPGGDGEENDEDEGGTADGNATASPTPDGPASDA